MTMNNMNHTEKLPIIDPQDPGYANYPDGVTTDVPKFQSSPTSIPVPEPEPVRAPQPPSSSGPQEPKKKPKKGVFRGNMTPAYIILTILSIAMNVLLVYVLFHTTRFSALGTDKFILINIVALAVLLLIDILVFVAIRSKKIWAFIISCLCLVLAVGGGGYANYVLTRVNANLEKITSREKTTEVKTSLVIYENTSGEPIMDINDLNGRKVGLVPGTSNADLAKAKLAAEGVNAEYVEFLSFAETFSALIGGKVDCAALPAGYAATIGTEPELEPYLEETSALLTFSESVTTENTGGSDKDLTKEPFTVLITGENETLADTIIVVSVNPISMKITMTSIARDSYVPITCWGGGLSKINNAHTVSEECMISTVEALTGIHIDYFVEFNFASVIQVVDAVGGVDVYNEVEFEGQCWDVEEDELVVLPIEAGYVHLDGQRALGFARERYAFEDGDFARQRHQQAVIEQVVAKVMATRDPNTYVKILDAAGENIRTNLSTEQMVNFVAYAMQKAKRYYGGSTNPAGVMDIVNNRITGYSAQLWSDGLDMYLYIYQVYNGSLMDTYDYVMRNIDMDSSYDTPESVSWAASDEDFVKPPMSADYYAEGGATTIGGPTETYVPEPEPQPEYTEPEYVEPEPTPEPQTEPVEEGGGE
ncbi:MAG: LCP family protein [Solobacterium sp.]|nr:LCP family protein [Solobacterium sp.]